jgi:hypothetical protein
MDIYVQHGAARKDKESNRLHADAGGVQYGDANVLAKGIRDEWRLESAGGEEGKLRGAHSRIGTKDQART